ncbi:MAG: lysophospholipid acyltransferase family protein [Blastocatellia bacterium]|nr:lysophospholipid acyltransferase family protein [Blastocatellia bacterium]
MSEKPISGPTAPYQGADLSAYTLKQRAVIHLATLMATLLLRCIGMTLRWDRAGFGAADPDNKRGGVPAGNRIIYTFWHNRILGATLFFRQRGIVVMTSQSFDGEIIARVIQNFGYGAARGSASKGSIQALKGMVRCVRDGHDVAFTIDGPKGPVYQAKPGAVMLARMSGAAILPMCVTTKNFWELRSWDRFRIPKPFSRARIAYGTPIFVSRGADEVEMEAWNAELQAALDRLQQESEEWG